MGPTCRRKTIFSANTLNIPTTEKKKKDKLQVIIITAIYCDNWKGKVFLDFQTAPSPQM